VEHMSSNTLWMEIGFMTLTRSEYSLLYFVYFLHKHVRHVRYVNYKKQVI